MDKFYCGCLRSRALSALVRTAILGICLLAGSVAGARPGGTLSPPAAVSGSTVPAASRITIGVLDEGWHTGLILPADGLVPPLSQLRQWFPDAKYFEFGWGNRDFYMTTKPKIGMAIASLYSSPSAVFVQGLQHYPAGEISAASEVHTLCVTTAGYRSLETFVGNYFETGQHGELVGLEPVPVLHGEFFASGRHYDAFHTCNTWTAAALRTAGLPLQSRGIIFAGQVMSEIRSLPACPQPAG